MKTLSRRTPRNGFTLIELLIVIAIIAILALIAVPNFLEAQVRAKVARSMSDMRSLATAIEAFAVDNGVYPEGTDNPGKYPQVMGDHLQGLAKGYFTFRTRGSNGENVGSMDSRTPVTPVSASRARFGSSSF